MKRFIFAFKWGITGRGFMRGWDYYIHTIGTQITCEKCKQNIYDGEGKQIYFHEACAIADKHKCKEDITN